jgi:DNA-binding NtrC family response regulator
MGTRQPVILVIDDERGMCELLSDSLAKDGYVVHTADNPHEGLVTVKNTQVDVVMLDLVMPEMDGIDVLKEIRTAQPTTNVVIMTAYGTVDTAVEAMKLGAYDYITKPFKMSKVKRLIERILERERLVHENITLRRQLSRNAPFENIVGTSSAMQELFRIVEKVAVTDCNVLIQAESGTGKELVARAIHEHSPRKDGPFVAQSCAALPEALLESEMFGHVKGAFTSATSDKHALLEIADGGTFFFDEVGEIRPSIQAKLLRVIEEREFKPVGGTQTVRVDIRIIAATNRDLHEAVAQGTFREDLFYRLNVVTIVIPPLRERAEDIPLLSAHFLEKYSTAHGKQVHAVSQEAMDLLVAYRWPGNVRELENTIERAVVLAGSATVTPHDLPPQLRAGGRTAKNQRTPTLTGTRQQAERSRIVETLRACGWRRAQAASALGVSRKTLWEKMKKYGIDSGSD